MSRESHPSIDADRASMPQAMDHPSIVAFATHGLTKQLTTEILNTLGEWTSPTVTGILLQGLPDAYSSGNFYPRREIVALSVIYGHLEVGKQVKFDGEEDMIIEACNHDGRLSVRAVGNGGMRNSDPHRLLPPDKQAATNEVVCERSALLLLRAALVAQASRDLRSCADCYLIA